MFRCDYESRECHITGLFILFIIIYYYYSVENVLFFLFFSFFSFFHNFFLPHTVLPSYHTVIFRRSYQKQTGTIQWSDTPRRVFFSQFWFGPFECFYGVFGLYSFLAFLSQQYIEETWMVNSIDFLVEYHKKISTKTLRYPHQPGRHVENITQSLGSTAPLISYFIFPVFDFGIK